MADLLEVTGMVIASGPIGEYDKRVVLLTKELGKISAFARGARKPGNALMAACDSFAFGTFSIYPGRNSYTVEKASIKNYFRELASDFDGACYGYYFLEFADYFARENEDGGAMLSLLYYSLKALLDSRIPDKLVRVVYELKELVINGEYPEFFCCTSCGSSENIEGFSIASNGVVCHSCMGQKNVMRISPSTLYTLQFIVVTPLEKLYSFTVKEDVLTELIEVMHRCVDTYVDKRMKSLDMLEMVDK